MKVIAKKVLAPELKPGDLFSTEPPETWELMQSDKKAIGFKCYIRTNAPCQQEETNTEIFKLKITEYKG